MPTSPDLRRILPGRIPAIALAQPGRPTLTYARDTGNTISLRPESAGPSQDRSDIWLRTATVLAAAAAAVSFTAQYRMVHATRHRPGMAALEAAIPDAAAPAPHPRKATKTARFLDLATERSGPLASIPCTASPRSGRGRAGRLRAAEIAGIDNPLYDARVPHLILAARRYRRSDSIAIFSQDHGWRLVVAGGMPVLYLPTRVGDTLESAPVATGTFDDVTGASREDVQAELDRIDGDIDAELERLKDEISSGPARATGASARGGRPCGRGRLATSW